MAGKDWPRGRGLPREKPPPATELAEAKLDAAVKRLFRPNAQRESTLHRKGRPEAARVNVNPARHRVVTWPVFI